MAPRVRSARRALGCVIGDMDLVRPLGLAGIRCAVVARPGARVRYSRFTRAVLEWADPSGAGDVLVERLLCFAAAQASRPVLYYEGDWDLLLISRRRDELARGFGFVIPPRELVEDLVDKARFQLLAARLRLPVPRGDVVSGDGPAAPAIDLPAVVKPLTRQALTWDRLSAGAKAVEVWTPDELNAVCARLAISGVDALVQELVPGPESRVESYHVYVDAQGDVVAEFTGRKIRTYPRHHGHSTALELTEERDVSELGRECIRRLGLRGVAKLDFKRAPDGSLFLLEVNPRFSLWHHLGAVAGVNIPALVYADLTGRPRPAAERTAGPVRWCQPRTDLLAARAAGISTARWLRFAAGCGARSSFAWDDPLPILRGALARARRVSAPTAAPAAAEPLGG